MAFFLEESNRLKSLPPYLFLEIDRAKRRAIESGVKVIDFGIGDPDQPTPKFILTAMQKAVLDSTQALQQLLAVLEVAWRRGLRQQG